VGFTKVGLLLTALPSNSPVGGCRGRSHNPKIGVFERFTPQSLDSPFYHTREKGGQGDEGLAAQSPFEKGRTYED